MKDDDILLSKEEAEMILQQYLGPSKWIAGNFVYLKRNRANPLDISYVKESNQIRLNDLRRYLGVKKLGHKNLDTHIGQLAHYSWLKIGHPTGGGFSQVYHRISRILEKYPAEQDRINSISRRLAYLAFLSDEIKYMNEKYDYEEIPIIFEFYTNKVEVFTTLLVGLLIIIGELWYDIPDSEVAPGLRPSRFQDIFGCFATLPIGDHQISSSINYMLELSAAISARHSYVHGIGPSISLSNDGGVIEYEIPSTERYGEFEKYMQHDLYDRLEKPPPANESITVRDSRFPEFELKRARGGRFHYKDSIVRYRGEVLGYIKMLERLLGLIVSRITLAILR